MGISALVKTSDLGFDIGYLYEKPTSWAGYIDNVLLYNHELTEQDIYNLYYDGVHDITVKADTSTTASNNASSGDTVAVPYEVTGGTINSLCFNTPAEVLFGDVTVYNYSKSVSPFTYTVNTTAAADPITDTTVSLKQTTNESFVSSWLTAIGLIGVCIIIMFASLLIGIVRGKGTIKDVVGNIFKVVLILVVILAGTAVFSQL